MIEFNLKLEKIGQCASAMARLQHLFISQPLSVLIPLISMLDLHKKGYLMPAEISGNPDPQFTSFLQSKLGSRVSYSVLASFIQAVENYSSGSYRSLNSENLQPQNLVEFLHCHYQVERLRKEVLGEMSSYVVGSDGRVGEKQFEEYCHGQKLSINPKIVFKTLSRNQQWIQAQLNPIKERAKGVSLQETRETIQKSRSNVLRLSERVDNFGLEWL